MQRIQFLSKPCKDSIHGNCDHKWTGLGIEVYCYCHCHNNKESNLCLETTANIVPKFREKKVLQSIGDQPRTVMVTSQGEIPQ